MSAQAATAAPRGHAGATSATRARVEELLPLVGAYLLLATLYAWQAWRRETPTIFSDELETTQISRAIADTGSPERRGDPYGFTSLVPWLTAPFWWLGPVASAYEAIKTVQAFVMAGAVFPAYLLARRVLTPGWATFAAVATIAAPALSYSPILVEEPWAYPAATLALWLTLRAVDEPSRRSIALAVGACLLAVLVRSQLSALLGALAFGLLVLGWRTDAMRRWRASWTRWDWVGAVVLGIGSLIAVVAFLGHRSGEWETATTLWKGRMVEYGSWAGGAFAIGVGVVPAIALLAVLAVPRGERERPGVRALVIVTAGAVVSFGWYAAIKGAYLSTTFSSLIVERNLVYLAPLAFAATAYLLSRGTAPVWSVLAGGAVVLALILWVPIDRGLDNFPYYEAHGLSILALANREWAWPLDRIENALVVLVLLATALLLLVGTPLRRRVPSLAARPRSPWRRGCSCGTSRRRSTRRSGSTTSARWSSGTSPSRTTGSTTLRGGSVVLLGQRMNDDPLGVPSTEFWNRSIAKVWSVDGTGPGPGHADAGPRGRGRHALARPGDRLRARERRRRGRRPRRRAERRIHPRPARRRAHQAALQPDRHRGRRLGARRPGRPLRPGAAAYNRFDVTEGGTGTALVNLSRETFCPEGVRLPGVARVRIGELGRGADKQPAIVRETASDTVYVPACAVRTVALPTPDAPWRVEVEMETFVPAVVDPQTSGGERRALGARVSFGVVPGSGYRLAATR